LTAERVAWLLVRAVVAVLLLDVVPLVISPRVLAVLVDANVSVRLKSLYTADRVADVPAAVPPPPTACLLLTGTPPLELTSLREAKAVRVLIGFLGVLILEG